MFRCGGGVQGHSDHRDGSGKEIYFKKRHYTHDGDTKTSSATALAGFIWEMKDR